MPTFTTLLLCLLASPWLYAQHTTISTLVLQPRWETDQASFVGASAVFTPVDTLGHQHYVYTFDLTLLTYVFPDDLDLRPSKLRVKQLPGGHYLYTQDLNGDGSFEGEVSHTMPPGQVAEISYPVFCDTGKVLDLSLLIMASPFYQSFQLIADLSFKYTILDHGIPQVDSILYHPCSLLPMIYVHSSQFPTLKDHYFIVDEPFLVGDNWYVVERPNLFSRRVAVRQLPPDERPLGYQPGYYANIERLTEQVNEALNQKVLPTAAEKRSYTLHHFWGPWCNPCVGEMDQVKALEERLEGSNLQMVNYCFIFGQGSKKADHYLRQLKQLQEEGAVSDQQVTIVLKPDQEDACKANSASKFKTGCNPVQLLNINYYPCYILMDPDGKILYRHSAALKGDAKFDALVQHILDQQKDTSTTAGPTPKSPRG